MPFPGVYDKSDNGRGITSKLWRDFNPAAIINDPGAGILIHEDYHTVGTTAEDYTLVQATTGTFAIDVGTSEFGNALLDSASGTAAQGANLQYKDQSVTAAAGRVIYFETRLKITDASGAGAELFAGLSVIETAILATSAKAATEHAGFYSVTDDSILLFGICETTTADVTTAVGTMVPGTAGVGTYIRLGFRINGLDSVEIYVNGTEKTAEQDTLAKTSIPDGLICPSFVCQSDGTTDPIMHIDYYRLGVKL